MPTDLSSLPLPPGERGLPLIGQTFAILKDSFHFIEERVARHGPIFRTRFLGKDAAIIAGPAASARLIDERLVQRDGGMPSHIQDFFGGRSLPLLDGAEHRARKTAVMAAFEPRVLAGYIPAMQACVERALAALADAGATGPSVPGLKRLAVETIGVNFTGAAAGPELATLLAGYETLTSSLGAIPLRLPGTRFTKALRARDAIFGVLRKLVAEHRATRRDDGLAHILDATLPDGAKLSDEHAALELHHIFLAGYIVYGLFVAALRQLDDKPEVRQKLAAEVAANAASGPITHSQLARMPYLLQVVKELKRLTPIVSMFFGQAKEDFELDGKRVPKGWRVIWALWSTNLFKGSFADPTTFDPHRFSPERNEDRDDGVTYVPQGAGPQLGHKCAGVDYTTLFLQVFLVALLRGYTWELPPQDLTSRWEVFPPEPKDGLRVRLSRSG